MSRGDKAKAALPLRTATLKQQAMITRQSSERQGSLKPALDGRKCSKVRNKLNQSVFYWTQREHQGKKKRGGSKG